MKQNGLEKTLAVVLGGTMVAAMTVSSPAQARDTKVALGIGSSYEHYSRSYDSDEKAVQDGASDSPVESDETPRTDERYNRLRITPLVALTNQSARDVLSLRYSPSLRYDDESGDSDVDQNLQATFSYALTRDWDVRFGESYVLTDQNIRSEASRDGGADGSGGASGDQLSDNEGLRRYWKNDLSFSTTYRYWEDSSFSLGYSLGHLTHTDVSATSRYEDYVRHGATLGVGHRLSSVWRLSANGSYARGLYEEAEKSASDDQTDGEGEVAVDNDLHEFRASTMIESSHFEYHQLSLKYGFTGVDYDDAERNATTVHDLTAGWQWQLAKDTSFSLGAGPSLSKAEEQEANWGYNATASLRYTLERSTFEASLAHGYDVQNFTGTDESGLREYWQSRLDFTHQLIKDVSLRLFTFYRNEDQEDVTAQQAAATGDGTATEGQEPALTYETNTFNRERFGVGTSLGYTFARWFSMGVSYDYLMQDSEQEDDSYDEHRVVVSLSMEMDVFNWQ